MKQITAFVPFGADEEDGYYLSEGAGTVKREYGLTPNGNAICGNWVYRNEAGVFIDFDQYRHDLFERHNIRMV